MLVSVASYLDVFVRGGRGGGRNADYRIRLHQSTMLNVLGHQIIISRTVLKSNLPNQTSVRF